MLAEQLAFFIACGYKEYESHIPRFPEQELRLLCKPVDTTVYCRANDKPPVYCLNYSRLLIHNRETEFFSLGLRAESSERTWYSLETYNLNYETLEADLLKIEQKLKLLWETLN